MIDELGARNDGENRVRRQGKRAPQTEVATMVCRKLTSVRGSQEQSCVDCVNWAGRCLHGERNRIASSPSCEFFLQRQLPNVRV